MVPFVHLGLSSVNGLLGTCAVPVCLGVDDMPLWLFVVMPSRALLSLSHSWSFCLVLCLHAA